MRKFITTLFAIATIAVQAQKIPNGSFDSWKGSCGDTYQSSRTEYRQRPGDEPTSWNGSSINQKVSIATKSETLIFKSTGRNGSAVKMQNKYVGAMGIGSNAPGFISFATPWVYAVTTVSKCDGGVYGGMAFNHRPDAIKGWFKRTGGTGEKAHIIVYLWKGTFKNNIASDKSNDTKDDTDRAVMGTVSSTGNGVRIASCDHTFTTTTNNDWQEITVPLNYENDYIPEKLNVILSSGDYWTRDNVKDGSVLEVDDVEFVYYSELASLVYGGKNYFQSGKTSYEIDERYEEGKLSLSSNGKGASIEKSYNSSTGVLTIQVKGNDYASNSSNVHTYTVTFSTEEPLEVVSVTPVEVVESLKSMTVEYSDEITGIYNAGSASKIYVGSSSNTASFSVDGKVLTITLDKAIETSGEYALYIPQGLITRKSSGKAVTCNGEIKFKVSVPFRVVAVTPSEEAEFLKTISVEYNYDITGTYRESDEAKIYLGSSENVASFKVNGKVLTVTLLRTITDPGEYGLYIPEGLLKRKDNGASVTCNGEIVFTVKELPEDQRFRMIAVTPSEPVDSLNEIVLEYNEEIKGTYNPLMVSQIYVDSVRTTTLPLDVNYASFSVEGKLLNITLLNTITAPGEYLLYIPEGLITRKSNGAAVISNGEVKFTIADVSVEPLEILTVTPGHAVESLQTIFIEYSDDIEGVYSESSSTKIYFGSNSNTASYVVDGNVLAITLDRAIETSGEYALYIPQGLITRKVNGEDVVCNGEIKFTVNVPEPEGPKELGDRLYSLDNASANKTYVLYNEHYTTYAIYEEGHGDKVWVAGMIGGDGDHQLKDSDYAQEVDITSENACWQVVKDGDKYQLYNVGAGMYLNTPMYTFDDNLKYCSFSSEPVSLSVVDLGGGKFAFNAYPSHANAEFGYMCAAPQLDAPLSVWSNDDSGAAWLLIENPNVTVGEIVEPKPEPTPGEGVDYTPTYTGTRNYSERDILAVKFVSAEYGEVSHDLTASERSSEYLDFTESFVFTVAPGEQVSVEIVTEGSWVNHYVYVDYDANGFAASIEGGSNWKPAGDMVAYSFYNNGGSSDASGWNSLGQTITGDGRSFPALPGFTVTSRSGLYRMRIKQDWCSIDPAGDSDSNFGGTFSDYGGQIIDVLLNVVDPTGIEDVEAEEAAVDIYDMLGRKLEQINKPGLYIIGGKKVLVK